MMTPANLTQLDDTMLLMGLCEAYRDMLRAMSPDDRQTSAAEYGQLRLEALRRMAARKGAGVDHPQEPFTADILRKRT